MKKNVIRTTAMFRCVVTFKSGMHKIVRMTIDKVAKLTAAIRQYRKYGMLTERYVDFFKELDILPATIASCKFVNERDGQELITL